MNRTRNSQRIRIALQKSGRLSEESINLLQKCGIKLKTGDTKLYSHCENFPLDVLFVRDDDIPNLLMDNICDLGIVGTNLLEEKYLERSVNDEYVSIEKVQLLDFGYCRLSIAVPDNFKYVDTLSLVNQRIATSYPFLLKKFLRDKLIHASVTVLNGSVEIAPHLGIADIICDLVSTGATLEANGLKEVATIFSSQAILVKANAAFSNEQHNAMEALLRRIKGVLQANESKYIMLHAPKTVVSQLAMLLPGAEHPTILPLEGDSEKVALHAVCRESVFWETMEKLKSLGASSILVLPVEKMLL